MAKKISLELQPRERIQRLRTVGVDEYCEILDWIDETTGLNYDSEPARLQIFGQDDLALEEECQT